MPQLTVGEQTRLARLAVDRTRRAALARVLRSPLMRWRYGAPVADELLIVPQDLRAADPSFAGEIEHDHFGLAGRVAHLSTGSLFDLTPPSAEWARELYGFGWLRHLRAANRATARATALSLVAHWIASATGKRGVAWESAVIARRLVSWISNAALLLEDVDQETYDRTLDSLADQLIHLSATWRDAPNGYPRLLALTALVYGDLCIAGHDRHLADIAERFADELARQILPDGGHISRNPGVAVEVLLDLLPLRQCFATRDRTTPAALDAAIRRMMPMLRFLRLGDGTLGRFNGMGAPSVDALATVLAYEDAPDSGITVAPNSRYARLEHGGFVVLVDVGPPPPLELASQAHAGCLSLEASSGAAAIFVNGGAPGPAEQDWRPASRATASHNTVCLGSKSSSKLVRHPLLESLIGGAPIRSPNDVSSRLERTGEGIALEASHDGYVRPFGLVHRRRLMLGADGARLEGRDRIAPARGHLRLARDIPFAVHFHLHPEVGAEPRQDEGAVDLVLRNGERWRCAAMGAALSLEESIHFADLAGPRQTLQIVLRGACFGDTDVRWSLDKVG